MFKKMFLGLSFLGLIGITLPINAELRIFNNTNYPVSIRLNDIPLKTVPKSVTTGFNVIITLGSIVRVRGDKIGSQEGSCTYDEKKLLKNSKQPLIKIESSKNHLTGITEFKCKHAS